MKYTTRHITNLFRVSHQTVKNWTAEFGDHLSPAASPATAGRQRRFTDDDLRVLALVAEMRSAGAVRAEIYAALAAGQRGEISSDVDINNISPPRSDGALLLVLRQKNRELEATIVEHTNANQRLVGQVQLLKEQLSEAQREIRQLESKIERSQGDIEV